MEGSWVPGHPVRDWEIAIEHQDTLSECCQSLQGSEEIGALSSVFSGNIVCILDIGGGVEGPEEVLRDVNTQKLEARSHAQPLPHCCGWGCGHGSYLSVGGPRWSPWSGCWGKGCCQRTTLAGAGPSPCRPSHCCFCSGHFLSIKSPMDTELLLQPMEPSGVTLQTIPLWRVLTSRSRTFRLMSSPPTWLWSLLQALTARFEPPLLTFFGGSCEGAGCKHMRLHDSLVNRLRRPAMYCMSNVPMKWVTEAITMNNVWCHTLTSIKPGCYQFDLSCIGCFHKIKFIMN